MQIYIYVSLWFKKNLTYILIFIFLSLFLDLGDTGTGEMWEKFWSWKVFATKNHQNSTLPPISWLKTCQCWIVITSAWVFLREVRCHFKMAMLLMVQMHLLRHSLQMLSWINAFNRPWSTTRKLEAKIRDLQKRLSEAEEPKDGKAQIQLDESSKGFLEIHAVWADVSEYLQPSDLRNLSFSETHDMLRKFFKTQLKLRDEKRQAAVKKEFQIWPQLRQWEKNFRQIWLMLWWQGRWQGDCRVSVHADEFTSDVCKPKRCNKKMRKTTIHLGGGFK